ncbi:beta-ureidopropionase [Anthonomus grandis grandis]|uniref:beta-ureidopropionase n=1 Tax=Anthonomus grandis grandis TaxID=2921223 RepID=UPI002165296D|nr:beta-ureidopropionase [Anthonomus grandis grandis]XP_050316201.1 beta-ureidopropionase [Anthonomus grandis grandis]
MSGVNEFESIEYILEKGLSNEDYEKVRQVLYGRPVIPLEISSCTQHIADSQGFEIKAYRIPCPEEQLRSPRLIRVAAFQNQIPLPTTTKIQEMKDAMFKMAKEVIKAAAQMDAKIFCFQEAWIMPFAFCTREKYPWCEYAESAHDGSITKFLQQLAKKYNMVIISPILERDERHSDTIWNTAVVIDNHGDYLGKHRKNHIPRVGDFNESTYYFEGNTGHPVFETEYGKIAVNICYGRHHPLNWLAFALNGAEIVFNPSATVGGLSEPLWGIEARNAAIANTYFTCAINRVGTEVFEHEFTSGNGKPAHKEFGYFYGSSYVAAPNGSRTPGLSRTKNGLLITEIDLNMCRQVKDHWGFQMTQRLEMYAELLRKTIDHDFKPQIVRKHI